MTVDEIEFKPITEYASAGNHIQICGCTYNGVEIIERSFFPWNIFKNMSVSYRPDLLIEQNSLLYKYCLDHDITLSDQFYTDEGWFMPICNTLEETCTLIDYFKTL